MEELLAIILQFLFEFVLEVISWLPFDFVPEKRWQPASLASRCLTWFFFGCGLAGLTVLFLKRTLIVWPVLSIANLLLAPLASAFLAEAIARRRRRRDAAIVPRNHFW